MWIKTADRLPPYGKWTIMRGNRFFGPAYRSHTDQQGEHYKSAFSLASQSEAVDGKITYWLDYPELSGEIA